MYQTYEVSEADAVLWNEIISECPHSNVYYTWQWRDVLSKSFKQLEPHYFLVNDDKKTSVAFPCFLFRPIGPFKMLHALPFNMFAGILMLEQNIEDIFGLATHIERKINLLAHRYGAFESLITLDPFQGLAAQKLLEAMGYERNLTQIGQVLELNAPYEEIWKRFRGNVRGQVKQAKKYGVEILEVDAPQGVKEYYQLYLKTIKRIKSAPKPISMFEEIHNSNLAKFLFAVHDNKYIAGILIISFNGAVLWWSAASDPEYWHLRPNNALVDYAIKWACEHNFRLFDLGGSPPENKGLIKFKEGWGAKLYHYHSYQKVYSPIRKKLWTFAEPTMRKAYKFSQNVKHQLKIESQDK